MQIPSKARAVIIGGGVIGCSIAYHLGKLGWKDVVLLERKQLTCGTTWHAAGLVAQLRNTQNMTRLAKYSQELYFGLEAETGVATGFKRNGSITMALNDERMEELRRLAAMARAFGVEIDEIGPSDITNRYPGLATKDAVGGVWLPKDGQADPVNITQALAKGARNFGVSILQGVKVTAIHQANGRVSGVDTDFGPIEAEYVVNAGGMWGREIGAMAGVSVPLHACEHFYIVTEPMPDITPNLPVLRVPDECCYFKEDAGKMLLGAFELVAKPWGMDGIPEDFEFDSLPEDFDHFEPILERAVERFPMLATAGVQTFFNGPESFTPDDRYILGEAPELDHFYVAAGFNSVGIASAGGAGMALAEWMDSGKQPFDLWDVDIRRMQPFQANRSYLKARVTETLGLLYADHFPYRQFASARGVRRSPVHHYLEAEGGCFGEVSGWERANWFLPQAERDAGKKAEYVYSWRRQNWFDYSAAEHMAVRQKVGMFDMSSFGKIKLIGRDAEAVLQMIAANDVAVPVGKIVYTQFLNSDGHIEADVTITRLSMDTFIIITPAATIRRDLNWINRHIPENAHAIAVDVTVSEAVLVVMGPEARDFLQPMIPQSLANEDFPFGTMQTVEIGHAIARAHRVTYVGELGWELYVPSDMAAHVFEAITERRDDHAIAMCGLHALDSCRIEKGFRHFGHDISNEDHVLEAGLGFVVKENKPVGKFGGMIGADAVKAKRNDGLSRRLVQFRLTDPEPLLYHNEAIYRDGALIGYLTSGNYGHHIGAAIGLGYVKCNEVGESAESQLSSHYQIDVAGRLVDAEVSLRPVYDPKALQVKI
ncbi:MAG: FAD-dependent oxidoreductase [Proteobacteria bacterium]|nr:FAD-dependent oxidoreductase [Pseudomonadota bacterium]MDA0960418.1 FAD-dependent oxidoreductase [Pseudomonadota bacterium]MDA1151965.1 FAD-dependent oxidoreductase [Pseudomonadota bacterium]